MTNLRGFWKETKDQPAKAKRAKQKKADKRAKYAERSDRSLKRLGQKGKGQRHKDYVANDRFYLSIEWRQLRYLVLKESDGRCQACGGSAADGIRLHVDHIVPRYKAPHLSLERSNCQVLCEDCNIGKGAWDDTDWRKHWKSI